MAPQLAQRGEKGVPHSRQKRASSGLAVPQLAQITVAERTAARAANEGDGTPVGSYPAAAGA